MLDEGGGVGGHHIPEQGKNKMCCCSDASPSNPSTIREGNSVFSHLKGGFSLNTI